MATSKPSAYLKEKRGGSVSPSHGPSSLHGRQSPRSSVPSSPEHERRSPGPKPTLNSSSVVSKLPKNQSTSAATAAHRLPTKKPIEKSPSASQQPSRTSTAQATLKERAATKTSSSTLPRAAMSSKPVSERALKTTPRSTRTQPLVRGRNPARSITKGKESTSITSTAPAVNEELPAIVPEQNEEEITEPTHVEEIESEKEKESDELKDTTEMEVSEEISDDSAPDEPEQDMPNSPGQQETDQSTLIHQEKDEDGDTDGNNINEELSEALPTEENSVAEIVEEVAKEEPCITEKPGDDSEDQKTEMMSTEEPVTATEPEKEKNEKEEDNGSTAKATTVKKPEVVQGGKKEGPKSNEVIEETRSKLMLEKKSSKVKALVGAFETVMSLQDE